MQADQAAVLNTYSFEYAMDSSQMSRGNTVSAVHQNDSVMSHISENFTQPAEGGLTISGQQQNSTDVRNSLKVDLKKFQMFGMAEVDTDMNPSIGHSHRSNQASIIKEIDKVTKFTAADITASIHVSQMQQQQLPSQNQKPP